MTGKVSVRSFLVVGTASSVFFFLGIAGYQFFSRHGLYAGFVAFLLFLVGQLLVGPVLGEGHRSFSTRCLTAGLLGLSVVPIMEWSVGLSLQWTTLAAGIISGIIGGELGWFLRGVMPSGKPGTHLTSKKVLIVGAGEAGEMLLRELRHQPGLHREVVGFLDDDPDKQGTSLDGDVPVLGTTDDLVKVCRRKDVDEVIIAMPSVDGEVIRSVIGQRSSIQADMRIVPGIREIIEGDFHWNQIRPVRPEDLLGRETVEVDQDTIRDFLSGKTVLVTGAAGSIGSYLIRHVLDYPVETAVGLDFNESDLYELEVSELNQNKRSRFEPVLGDVRDSENIDSVVGRYQPDILLHAAALKHVPMVERHPREGVMTNVTGCMNVFEAAREHSVNHCLLISTDKAVNPKNIMGFTKKMGEKLVGTYQQSSPDTRFAAVRFGNVLGSRGSVVPLFKRQIEEGGPVTVTDPEMVRYFMTPAEAVKLVLTAASFEDRGSTYVLDIGDPIPIIDLARQLIALMGYQPETEIPIEIVGLREGESLKETLFAEDESPAETNHPKIQRIDSPGLNEDQFRAFESFLKDLPNRTEQLVDDFKQFLESG